MVENAPQILPACEVTEEEYLIQAEAEIRRHGKLFVSSIMAIGKKLTEVKSRVGHGRYGQFIRKLGFSERSAQQMVQSYKFLKSAHCADFESLQIDPSALRLLVRSSTPEEVRFEALERAAKPEGITYTEVRKLIAEAIVKAKDEGKKEAGATKSAKESASLAEQVFQHELALAQSDQQIVESVSEATTPVRSVRAEINTQHQGNILPSQDQTPSPEATIKESTSPATEEAVADAKNPPDPLVDTELSSRAAETRKAIVHCVGAIKLTPEQCLAAETESGLAQIALVAKRLTLWLKEFSQRYARKLKGEQLPLPLDDMLPFDDTLRLFRKRPPMKSTVLSQ